MNGSAPRTMKEKAKDFRPYFHLSDAFIRTFGLADHAKHLQPHIASSVRDLSPVEEFNFSKAAIKYSNSITKDQIFSGLRYLLQAIGELFKLNNKSLVVIDFEVGRLQWCQDKSAFTFNPKIYKNQGLSVPQAAVIGDNNSSTPSFTYQPSITFQKEATADALTLRLDGKNSAQKVSKNTTKAVVSPPPADAARTDEAASPMPRTPASVPSVIDEDTVQEPEQGSEYSSDEEEEEDSTPPAPVAGNSVNNNISGLSKQEIAYKSALSRHLSEMELRASEAIKSRSNWENYVNSCLEQVKCEDKERKSMNVSNASYVKKQMELNEMKRSDERKQWIESASSHNFPSFSEPPSAELEVRQKKLQDLMRSELDLQIRTSNAMKDLSRQKERQLEILQMRKNKSELSKMRDEEINKKLNEKKVLAESWNREVRMKQIWKSIENHSNAPTINNSTTANTTTINDMFDDSASLCSCSNTGKKESKKKKVPPASAAQSLLLMNKK